MTKQEVEYEEAPSGYVTFYNYKTPLMKFEKGHGFIGALVFDGETDKLQCHLCGEWHAYLPNHLAREHNIKASAYKEMVGLNQSTALISEKQRAKLIANGLDIRKKNLRPGGKQSEESKRKISETLKKNSAEMKNLRNTCPEQLISRLKNRYVELGRTPTEDELPFHETIRKVYGSMKTACKIAGIPYRKPSVTVANQLGLRKKYPRIACVEWIRNFYDSNGRLPKYRDLGKKGYTLWITLQKHGLKKLLVDAQKLDGKYRKINKARHSKEALLKFLVTFEQINGRKPSYSDCKRGLLPTLSRYSYNFGSWKNALKLAFPK